MKWNEKIQIKRTLIDSIAEWVDKIAAFWLALEEDEHWEVEKEQILKNDNIRLTK